MGMHAAPCTAWALGWVDTVPLAGDPRVCARHALCLTPGVPVDTLCHRRHYRIFGDPDEDHEIP